MYTKTFLEDNSAEYILLHHSDGTPAKITVVNHMGSYRVITDTMVIRMGVTKVDGYSIPTTHTLLLNNKVVAEFANVEAWYTTNS